VTDVFARRHRILKIINERKRPMTVREVMKAVGYRSTSSAWAQLEQLESLGLLRKVAGYELTASGRAAIEEQKRQHWETRGRVE